MFLLVSCFGMKENATEAMQYIIEEAICAYNTEIPNWKSNTIRTVHAMKINRELYLLSLSRLPEDPYAYVREADLEDNQILLTRFDEKDNYGKIIRLNFYSSISDLKDCVKFRNKNIGIPYDCGYVVELEQMQNFIDRKNIITFDFFLRDSTVTHNKQWEKIVVMIENSIKKCISKKIEEKKFLIETKKFIDNLDKKTKDAILKQEDFKHIEEDVYSLQNSLIFVVDIDYRYPYFRGFIAQKYPKRNITLGIFQTFDNKMDIANIYSTFYLASRNKFKEDVEYINSIKKRKTLCWKIVFEKDCTCNLIRLFTSE